MTDDILVDVDATGVAVVTLNRPEKRNVVSLAMSRRSTAASRNVATFAW
jgi:enoyl-CoA hydratase/carnithine racemase